MASRLLYNTAFGRRLANRYGRAVWRTPAVFRKRMVFAADVRRLPGVKAWAWRAGQTVRPRPTTNPAFAARHALAARPYHVPRPFVHQLPRAWLVGQHAAVVTDRGALLLSAFGDSAACLELEPNADLAGWLAGRGWDQWPGAGRAVWADACSLVSRLDTNYYHCIVDYCGQVEAIERYELQTGIRPAVLVRGGGAAYVRASLGLLGIDAGQVLEWSPERPPQAVERMVVSSRPSADVVCSPASLRWLRARTLTRAGLAATPHRTPWRRLYISRPAGGWRAVLNDEDVLRHLERHGFDIVRPETLPFLEQVRLFAEARLIVGLHGAGLTNVLFAPGSAVVELVGNYGGGDFYSMSSALGQPYAAIACEPHGQHVRVDVEAVLRLADQLGGVVPPAATSGL